MLKGGQKKLDANKDGKISGEDFKLLRSKKGMKEGGPADTIITPSDADIKFLKKMMDKKEGASDTVITPSDADIKFLKKMMDKKEGASDTKETRLGRNVFKVEKIKKSRKRSERNPPTPLKPLLQRPERKSKGGSIFSRNNYKRTGKI